MQRSRSNIQIFRKEVPGYWNLSFEDIHGGRSYRNRRRKSDRGNLESTQTLRELTVCVGGDLPSLDTLKHIGKTLDGLDVHSLVRDRDYSTSSLEELVAACPRLTTLYVNIGDFRQVIDNMTVLESYELSALSGLKGSLVSSL